MSRPAGMPRRSHDVRPPSPTDESRPRASSDGTRRSSIPTDVASATTTGAASPNTRRTKTSGPSVPPSASSTTNTLHLPPVRSSSRADHFPSRDTAPSPAFGQSTPRVSPQKHTRTYDSKLISREMDRLGMIHGLSSQSLAPTAASSSTLSLPTSSLTHEIRSHALLPSSSNSNLLASAAAQDTPWTSLGVHVLPLFSGEPLRVPIEDLNQLVKQHIQSELSQSLSKAVAKLEADLTKLVSRGMLSLNAKLANSDNAKVVNRLVDLWTFFWVQVLPYVEGVFLPLQTEPHLKSLARQRGHRRGSSSTSDPPVDSPLDVRRIALLAFRDEIIYPRWEAMYEQLAMLMKDGFKDKLGEEYQQPRLQQMLLVLGSNSSKTSLSGMSEPAPGEHAVAHLLRVVRRTTSPLPYHDSMRSHPAHVQTMRNASGGIVPAPYAAMTTFVSGPRDRRGRIHLNRTPSQTQPPQDSDVLLPNNALGLGADPVPSNSSTLTDTTALQGLDATPRRTQRLARGGSSTSTPSRASAAREHTRSPSWANKRQGGEFDDVDTTSGSGSGSGHRWGRHPSDDDDDDDDVDEDDGDDLDADNDGDDDDDESDFGVPLPRRKNLAGLMGVDAELAAEAALLTPTQMTHAAAAAATRPNWGGGSYGAGAPPDANGHHATSSFSSNSTRRGRGREGSLATTSSRASAGDADEGATYGLGLGVVTGAGQAMEYPAQYAWSTDPMMEAKFIDSLGTLKSPDVRQMDGAYSNGTAISKRKGDRGTNTRETGYDGTDADAEEDEDEEEERRQRVK